MVEPVNLNRFKKQKARAAQKVRADQNSVRFGRNSAEKELSKTKRDKATRHLDGHQIDHTPNS